MASPAGDKTKQSNVLDSKMKKGSGVKNVKESVPLDSASDLEASKNLTTELVHSDVNGSLKTTSSANQKPKSTLSDSVRSAVDDKNAKIPRNKPQKSSSESTLVKSLANEVKQMKVRIRKLEDEVSTLHELLKVQDDITAETLAILPDSFKNDKSSWKKHSNPSFDYRGKPDYNQESHKQDQLKQDFYKQDHHKQEFRKQPKQDYGKQDHPVDKNVGSMDSNSAQALMMNNHAWYGDAFLFELMCQVKGYHPKEDNWFTSVHPFVAYETFCNRLFDRKSYYRTCVFSIGYSDLFNAKGVTGYAMKQTLHALLNKMHERGANRIKVLSVPPARQMMKNVEYLKICQTTNKFLKAITRTHTFVDFINLDKFFINNPDDFFDYIDANNEVQVQINDHLLMRKVNDHFEIFIDPETAKEVVDYIIEYTPSTSMKGYQTINSSNGTFPNKRRLENIMSPDYAAKRKLVSRSDDEYDESSYRDHCDRRYDDYERDKLHARSDYDGYDYRRERSSSRSESSPPPWLKK